jgi:hypothetical protein
MAMVNFAIMLAAILGIAALALDIGVMYTAHTSAQHAADAGALAGAFTFINTPNAPQPSTAIQDAIAVANQNKILGKPVAINAGNVSVDLTNRRVTVQVSTTMNTFFAAAPAIARKFVNIAAVGTAEAWKNANGSNCLKPIFIPNTALAPAGFTISSACTAGQILFNSTTNPPQLTAWAQSMISTSPLINLRPTGGSTSALDPSQYYSIDFSQPTSPGGAALYQCTIESCLNDCGVPQPTQWCGVPLTTENGNMPSATLKGFQTLLGPSPDVWTGNPGDYSTQYGALDTSRSLILAPVWDDCKQPIKSGKQTFPVVGFVTAFVNKVANTSNGTTVTAYIVAGNNCNTIGPAGSGPTGPSGVPLRLVQNPSQ